MTSWPVTLHAILSETLDRQGQFPQSWGLLSSRGTLVKRSVQEVLVMGPQSSTICGSTIERVCILQLTVVVSLAFAFIFRHFPSSPPTFPMFSVYFILFTVSVLSHSLPSGATATSFRYHEPLLLTKMILEFQAASYYYNSERIQESSVPSFSGTVQLLPPIIVAP